MTKNHWLPFEDRWENPVFEKRKKMTTRPNLDAEVGDMIRPYSWEGKPYRSKWRKWGCKLKITRKFKVEMVLRNGVLGVMVKSVKPHVGRNMTKRRYAKREGFTGIEELQGWFLSHYNFMEGKKYIFFSYLFELRSKKQNVLDMW